MKPDLKKLSRKDVRYWLFRFMTEAFGGAKATGAPSGLKAHFESLKWCQPWAEFSIKWDVDPDSPLDIVPLTADPQDAWNEELALAAKELPKGVA